MPPTANSASGKTSVCSTPRAVRLALGLGAGHGGRLAGERGQSAVELTLGEQQHADQRQDQQECPR